MKMIEVLVKQANKEIRGGTILKIPYYQGLFGNKSVFEFNKDHFFGEEGLEIEELYPLDTDFLNSEVELIPPKPKKYLVKFNMRGLRSDIDEFCYLNYVKKYEYVDVDDKTQNLSHKTQFTKQELQSIQPVREFLEDMEGKYELIEVEENEVD